MDETSLNQPRHPDYEQIQGAWKIVLAWTSGKRTFHAVDNIHVFQEDVYWWDAPHLPLQSNLFHYRINPTTTPKSVDLISDEGISQGIYRLTSQTLTTCFPEDDGAERPTEFVSCLDRGWNMSIAKRLAVCPQRASDAD